MSIDPWHYRVRSHPGLPLGVMRLGNFQMDRLLSLASSGLQELTISCLDTITSHAFFPLRMMTALTTVTIAECPCVDDHVGLAMPPSVRELNLACAGITGEVASYVPSTITTLRLVHSGVTSQHVRNLRPPPGCTVDIAMCPSCDRPAHVPSLTRCERCTLVNCKYCSSAEADGSRPWHRSACSKSKACGTCAEHVLCSDCEHRDRCQLCERVFCDGDCDQMRDCMLCVDRTCPNCFESQACAKCNRQVCGGCVEDGHGNDYCVVCDTAYCTMCRDEVGCIFCDACGEFACGDHAAFCACCGESGKSTPILCHPCLQRGRRILQIAGFTLAPCSSADCDTLTCEQCAGGCTVCGALFCPECAPNDDDDGPHATSTGQVRARMRQMGFDRPFKCGECGEMFCTECSTREECAHCGLVSCTPCGRVRQCSGCDERVCLFCPHVEMSGTCCSLAAGWHGEVVEINAFCRQHPFDDGFDFLPRSSADEPCDSDRGNTAAVLSGGPLAGVRACFSLAGSTDSLAGSTELVKLASACKSLGAVLYKLADLKNSTHLIFDHGDAGDYQHAYERGVHIVRPIWIEMCRDAGVKVKEEFARAMPPTGGLDAPPVGLGATKRQAPAVAERLELEGDRVDSMLFEGAAALGWRIIEARKGSAKKPQWACVSPEGAMHSSVKKALEAADAACESSDPASETDSDEDMDDDDDASDDGDDWVDQPGAAIAMLRCRRAPPITLDAFGQPQCRVVKDMVSNFNEALAAYWPAVADTSRGINYWANHFTSAASSAFLPSSIRFCGPISLHSSLMREHDVFRVSLSDDSMWVCIYHDAPSKVHGLLRWRTRSTLVARLPVTQLSQFVAYRTSEWSARLLSSDGIVRLHLIPPKKRLWSWDDA